MLDDLWRYSPVGAVPTVVAGALLLVALVAIVALALCDVPRSRTWVRWLLVVVVAAVVVVTLLGPGAGSAGVNLEPGRTIREELVDNVNHSLGVANVIGNVLLFVPLGSGAVLGALVATALVAAGHAAGWRARVTVAA